jgi:hypothetical protein
MTGGILFRPSRVVGVEIEAIAGGAADAAFVDAIEKVG